MEDDELEPAADAAPLALAIDLQDADESPAGAPPSSPLPPPVDQVIS